MFNNRLNNMDKQGRKVFNPDQSKTFQDIKGSTFNISYGDASFAHGTVGKDTVDIGGATVENQAIGLPNDVSQSFADDEASDGLVGLAFTSINTMLPEQQPTFLDNVAPDLDQPVLTAQLKSGAPGSYEFGIIDKSKFLGDLVKVPVDASNGFWEITSTQFAVGDGKQTPVSKGAQTAIADTGTSLMLINDEIVQAYYEQVEGSLFTAETGGFIYPCSTKLPDLYVAVGEQHLAKIPGSVVNFATVGTNTTTGEDCTFHPPFSISYEEYDANNIDFSVLRRCPIQPGKLPPDLRRCFLQGSLCRFRPERSISRTRCPCLDILSLSELIKKHKWKIRKGKIFISG